MTAQVQIGRSSLDVARDERSSWKRHLAAVGATALAILLLFHRDAIDILEAWWTSATFHHVLFVPPLIAWLVWQRRDSLARLTPAGWWPGLGLVGLGALAWLVGEAGGAALARHAGLVLMLQGAVVAVLGPSVARGLAFPLLFSLFLIPAGEEIVPQMQVLTARLAMVFLGWIGVPANLDGIFITTAAGWFEVAEACAGVMFLVAMLAFSTLAANLCFRSWRRQILFVAGAIAVAILANGIRAAGTIWAAGIYGVEAALGFDHIFYGWIFFALVIALVMAGARPFFDRRPGDPWFDPGKLARERTGPPPARVAAVAVALAAIPLLWSATAMSSAVVPPAALPEVAGWTRSDSPDWRPNLAGARIARYIDRAGRVVELAVASLALDGLPAIDSVAAGPRWAWTSPGAAPPPGARSDRIASHGRVREVVSAWRVGNSRPVSAMGMKLAVMRTRLLGGPPVATVAMVSAESRTAIDSFLGAAGPLDRLAGGR
jgi:exosortase A